MTTERCPHERLDEEGYCRKCGADMRSGVDLSSPAPQGQETLLCPDCGSSKESRGFVQDDDDCRSWHECQGRFHGKPAPSAEPMSADQFNRDFVPAAYSEYGNKPRYIQVMEAYAAHVTKSLRAENERLRSYWSDKWMEAQERAEKAEQRVAELERQPIKKTS